MPGKPKTFKRRVERGDPVALAELTIRERRKQSTHERLPDLASVPTPDPGDLLTFVLKDMNAMYRLALIERDALSANRYWIFYWDAQGNRCVRPHPWVLEADRRGADLSDLLLQMQRHGIAERMATIEEAKAAVVMLTMERILERVGLTDAQRAMLGPILREEAAQLREAPVLEGRVAA